MRRISPYVLILSVVWISFLLWILWGYFSVRGVEQPEYTVLERYDGYEVRRYPAYLAAQVSVRDSWSSALDEGFSVLSDYISGNNISGHAIEMTRPVDIEAEIDGELIAITAPILTQEKGDGFVVSFIIPATYTSETLPRPNNPEIRIVQIASATVAVRTFGGRVDAKRAQREEDLLRRLLSDDRRMVTGAARLAQYSPPWTPPFMRSNEIIVPVRSH